VVGTLARLILAAVVGAALTAGAFIGLPKSYPEADPHGLPVECASRGGNLDASHCYQQGHRVHFRPVGYGAQCDGNDYGKGWYQLGGAGGANASLSAGSTTFGCLDPKLQP